MKKQILVLASVFSLWGLQAAIVPVSPVAGKTIQLVPDAQKKLMNMPTYKERLEFLQWDRANGKKVRHDPNWRKALPVVLEWKATAGEKGPWKILIGKKPDLSDARVWFKAVKETDKATGRESGKDQSQKNEKYEVPYANLEINTTYYWRVCTRGYCGWGCNPKHGCEACKKVCESEIASFKTEDFAPRWMAIEGRVGNMRDLGGRKTVDGRRVKQGMIYRGQGLNDNSTTGEIRGRNRLTAADVEYMTGTLGIKTDLDQRSPGEVADMTASPLGPSVKWIHNSSSCYAGIFLEDGKKAMAKNFRVFCDPANYPIYFHCIGGADRAGSLAYTLNGILGVERHLLNTDWESTFYPTLPEMRSDYKDHTFWCGEWHFDDGFAKYGDANTSWNKRIELYLLDCGVTMEEIEKFRSIMLE
ncbi:MAG: tyrosine-protein phosphatase [Kiritimatiellia bacterium]